MRTLDPQDVSRYYWDKGPMALRFGKDQDRTENEGES